MKLKANDTIGIIAPSGAIADKEAFFKKVQKLNLLGFKTKVFENVLSNFDFLASSDENRISDLHSAFLDPEISAILCARGGYGALRIVDKIDYEIIKNNPKIFIGFSDITLLHMAIFKKTGLKTFHAPMLLSGFADDKFKDTIDTINGFKKEIKGKKILKEGCVNGILWGGNLSTIVSSFGGEDFTPNADIVLFLEDINEPLYKLDKMMTQILRNKNLAKKVKALIFGEFSGLLKNENNRLCFWQKKWADEFNVPSSLGFPISHTKVNSAIPFGQKCKFEAVKNVGTKICLLYD